MIEIFGIVAGVLAVFGVLLNNRRLRVCFYVWIVSNAMCIYLHWQAHQNGADAMLQMIGKDTVFLLLAIEGLIKWKRK